MTDIPDPRSKLDPDLRSEIDRIERQIKLFNWIAIGSVSLGMLLASVAFFWLQPVDEISEAVVAAVGVASAFWALAGLFLLYVSFLGQRVDLVYNRQELRDTREQIEGQRIELARQAELMELQGETIGRQAFEGMFFQLLRRLGDVVATLEITVDIAEPDGTVRREGGTGVKAFRLLAEALRGCFIEESPHDASQDPATPDTIAQVYGLCYARYGHFIGHYMENLKTMLQLIDQQGHDVETSRQVYADIVAAQLSVPERTVLYYHCRTGLADRRLDELIGKYGILEQVRPEHLLEPAHHDVLGSA